MTSVHGLDRQPLNVRFWSRVLIGGPDDCWMWDGATQQKGYGQVLVDGRPQLTHRVAWFLTYRAWPKFCQPCEVRLCCNPRHLTASDIRRARPLDYEAQKVRFWSKVLIGGSDECWPWTAGAVRGGYGKTVFDGKQHRAPRVAFFLTYGVWPEICRHSCDNPPCVNPAHLSTGSNADNVQDAVDRGRRRNGREGQTRCINGHEFSSDNTYVNPSTGHRRCRTCLKLQIRNR